MLKDGQYDAFWSKAANVSWDPKPAFSDDFKRLIWDMLKFDPKDRITAEEAEKRAKDLGWFNSCTIDEREAFIKSRLHVSISLDFSTII